MVADPDFFTGAPFPALSTVRWKVLVGLVPILVTFALLAKVPETRTELEDAPSGGVLHPEAVAFEEHPTSPAPETATIASRAQRRRRVERCDTIDVLKSISDDSSTVHAQHVPWPWYFADRLE
jgi:hypothetical protein